MTEDERFWKILTSTVMPFKCDKVKAEPKRLKVRKKIPDIYPTVLDLHGKTIQATYDKTLSFIDKHISLKTRYITIITGKARESSGKIRKEIDGWLETDKFKKNITKCEWLNGNGAVRLTLKV